MKKYIKFFLPLGLLIYVLYQIISRFINIPDLVAIPAFIISIILMLAGLFYNGWCLGKNKNPYDLSEDKNNGKS